MQRNNKINQLTVVTNAPINTDLVLRTQLKFITPFKSIYLYYIAEVVYLSVCLCMFNTLINHLTKLDQTWNIEWYHPWGGYEQQQNSGTPTPDASGVEMSLFWHTIFWFLYHFFCKVYKLLFLNNYGVFIFVIV